MFENLFPRSKRQARSNGPLTCDLKDFRNNDQAYLNFIENLTAQLSEPNEKYGNIRVSRRSKGVIKVIIKDSAVNKNLEVGFIYRVADLYIVGLVIGNTFYIDNDTYIEQLKKKIPTDWQAVINVPNTEVLTSSFSYANILRGNPEIGKLGESLEALTGVADRNKRIEAQKQLGPFVVAFAEAVRFPVIAQEVQDLFRKLSWSRAGILDLKMNIVEKLSLGHTNQRTADYRLEMFDMILFWDKLSDRVPALYGNPPKDLGPLKIKKLELGVGKSQLGQLLRVANSQGFSKLTPVASARGKRDLTSLLDTTTRHNLPLLQQQIKFVDYEGNVQQVDPPPPTTLGSITHSADIIGGLQLLTVGMLYLYRKKMSVPLEVAQGFNDPRKVFAVAVDISERIECFLRTAYPELEIGFEEAMELQRRLAGALIRGDGMETVLTLFLEQQLPKAELDDKSMKKLQEQLIQALADQSGLREGLELPTDMCFQ